MMLLKLLVLVGGLFAVIMFASFVYTVVDNAPIRAAARSRRREARNLRERVFQRPSRHTPAIVTWLPWRALFSVGCTTVGVGGLLFILASELLRSH